MKVRYLGNKKFGMGVLLPVGVRNLSSVKGKLLFTEKDPVKEMDDKSAFALVSLNPTNFEIVAEEVEVKRPRTSRKSKEDKEIAE